MRFTEKDVLQFAEWSADRNPLHVDASYARRTHFGQPVVHGMLSVLQALEQSGNDGTAIRHLDVEFRSAVLINSACEWTHEKTDETFAVTLTAEGSTALVVRGSHADIPAIDPTAFAWAANGAHDRQLLLTPRERTLDELRGGVEVTGSYPVVDVPGAPERRFRTQRGRVLALCSYIVGMELPGRSSLFTRATIEFHQAEAMYAGPFRFRATSTRFDSSFRLLDIRLEVATLAGIPLATAVLRSYVPFGPIEPDVEALTHALGPDVRALAGKVAWVIGGTRGLGADLTTALALSGCTVYAVGRTGPEADARWVQALRNAGRSVEFLCGDAADSQWCAETADTLRARHGRIDLLILNACAPPSALRITSEADEDFGFYVSNNLRLVRAPLAAWAAGEHAGTLVYISSSFATEPPPGLAHYAALKQAAETLVRSVQRERSAADVVIARPGPLQTSWNDTPLGAATSIPAAWAAAHIVNAAARRSSEPRTEILSVFPAIERRTVEAADKTFTIALSASFTADPLVPGLEFWSRELGLNARVRLAPYGQTLQTLLDPQSEFSTNHRGINVVLLRVHDWLRELPQETLRSRDALKKYLFETVDEFDRAMRAHRSRARIHTLLLLCPGFDDAAPDNDLVFEAEAALRDRLQAIAGLQIATAEEWHDCYDVDLHDAADRIREDLAHIPYSDRYLATLSTILARHIHRRLAAPRKVIVVDCDNTLWRGVVGEVGADGIQFERGHRELHDALARLAANGVLIALCSKNEEPDVWRVFETRTDFGLKREQVVAAAINWRPKSENLRRLAARLNLGLDSFLFIDDNPVECAEVRAACPEVLTLEWPSDERAAVRFVRHTWELDAAAGTAEDERRTELYREEFRRQELRDAAASFTEFIRNLDLRVDLSEVTAADVRRAAQLTLRTNQFNFTTKRRDESEMDAVIGAADHLVRLVRVQDRFGDYGIVGLIIIAKGADVWRADSFLLSCRVLGRGVEHRMAAEIGRMAVTAGAKRVSLRVEATKRNTPARAFLESIAGENLVRDDSGIECSFDPAVLCDLKFEPTDDTAQVFDDPPSKGGHTTSDPQHVRTRERLISRTVASLSDPAGLHAAIHGELAQTRATPASVGGVATIVVDAFASSLGLAPNRIQQLDRLDVLGCESMKIVEITVALLEHFPTLPTTLLFEHSTVSAIIREIEKLVGDRGTISAPERERVTSPQESHSLDIAVVGMHVRCAGARSLDELWDLLSEGRSAVAPVPPHREWFVRPLDDTRPHWAGLLEDVGTFEPEFFGISPREAEVMDPQLRLFLEVAWSALEDAGCAGRDLERETGVFVGAMYGDYAEPANDAMRESGSPYRSWERFSLANRLSQVLNVNGPSLAVDTACSSSATALHFACRALKAGDCRVAVVGGVNLILDPDRFASLGRLGILSATGTCVPFGAGADGTVLGEGAGAVILRPLQDAIARGDRIYGVIKGSGVSTGHGTVGFTAPNPQAQARAIERALESSRVDPRTISYVETHGTGTELGDPIEVRGLALGWQNARTADHELDLHPSCTIGSIKPTIGHLEAGAGIVSLIKVLLQLHRGRLVPSLTSDAPNPHIQFADSPFSVQRRLDEWRRPVGVRGGVETIVPRRAGLSSFGVGGANAHFIVEEAPQPVRSTDVERPAHVLALSGRSRRSLELRARELADFLRRSPHADVADVCYSANTGRAHFEHRFATRAQTRDALIASLSDVSEAQRSGDSAAGIAFLFTGQGAQYVGMGRALYSAQPVFRAAMDQCALILDPLLPQPLLSVVFAEPGTAAASLLDQTGFTQPSLFAIQYALAQLWKSWGIEPAVVMGHSVGEFAALCVAGAVSLEDGLMLIAARGRLMQALPAGGVMVSTATTEKHVRAAIASVALGDQVSVAAVNGPRQIVISGAAQPVAAVVDVLEAEGVRTRALTVSHAFHSPLMKPMLAEYARVVRTINFRTPSVQLVSSVTGVLAAEELKDPDYWIQQIMQPVQFTRAVESIRAADVSAWVEIGPQPVLIGMAQQCEGPTDSLFLASIRRDADSWTSLLDSAARLYMAGFDVDWRGFDAPYVRRRVTLPPYPFSRKRYWVVDGPRASRQPATPPSTASTPKTYEMTWEKLAFSDAAVRPSAQRYLLLSRGGVVPSAIAARLRGAGHACAIIENTEDILRHADRAATAILYLRPLESAVSEEGTADADALLEDALRTVQILGTHVPNAPIWFVTQAAVPLCTDRPRLAGAALWGFARTFAGEQPARWGGILDVSSDPPDFEIDALLRQITAPDGEDQVILRGRDRYVARLVESGDAGIRAPFHASDGTYLITGGLGALGLRAARWLAYKGAKHLVLAGRSASPDESSATLEELRKLGVRVTVRRLDVANAADVAQLVSNINAGPAPLRGIIHAAGVDMVRPLTETTPQQLRDVTSAKIAGAWNLHKATDRLDLFLLFSSISSVLGSNGRIAYSAANAFLDALAIERRRCGLPALSVNWGPWAGGGLATTSQLEQLDRMGNHALDPEQAFKALDLALRMDTAQISIADIDWETFRPVYDARRPRPILGRLGGSTPVAASADTAAAELDLVSILRDEAARTLGYDNSLELPLDRRFSEMGMDSLLAADFAGRLRKRLGQIPACAVFDHPSVQALASHLKGAHAAVVASAATGVAPAPEPVVAVATLSASAGISGMERYSPEMEAEVLAFQREAFPMRDPDLIPGRWQWMFVESARRLGLPPLFWLFRDNGRIVGQMGSIPVRVKIGEQEYDSGWLVDTMVLEEYRSQAIGSRLMLQAQEDAPFSLSLGQSAEMRQIQDHLGWQNLAPLQVHQFLVRPERVLKGKLPSPAATVAGLALRATSATRDWFRRRPGMQWRAVSQFGGAHDALWQRVAPGVSCAVVRNASYLNWKYVDQPGQDFLRLELVDQAGALRGIAVWMMRDPDELYAYRRGHLMELLTPLSEDDVVDDVLHSACQVAAEGGADSLIAMSTDVRLSKAFSRAGFLKREPSRFLLVDPGTLQGQARELARSGENWFITQGDSDIDRP